MMNSLIRPMILTAIVSIAALLVFTVALSWFGRWDDERKGLSGAVSDGYCNIAVVPIIGDIVAYDAYYDPSGEGEPYTNTTGDWTTGYIRAAESDPNVFGTLVTIDSYGGQASPAFEIMHALSTSEKPVAAYIRESGTSAAYIVALGSDEIIASPFASVGSIGVTYSYLEETEKNNREGLRYIQLASGPYKDAGAPYKPLTDGERALFERDIEIYKNVFITIVAERRGISEAKVAELADGSSWPASLALEEGLVDQVGDMDSVRTWFAGELGLASEQIVFCN